MGEKVEIDRKRLNYFFNRIKIASKPLLTTLSCFRCGYHPMKVWIEDEVLVFQCPISNTTIRVDKDGWIEVKSKYDDPWFLSSIATGFVDFMYKTDLFDPQEVLEYVKSQLTKYAVKNGFEEVNLNIVREDSIYGYKLKGELGYKSHYCPVNIEFTGSWNHIYLLYITVGREVMIHTKHLDRNIKRFCRRVIRDILTLLNKQIQKEVIMNQRKKMLEEQFGIKFTPETENLFTSTIQLNKKVKLEISVWFTSQTCANVSMKLLSETTEDKLNALKQILERLKG